MSKRFQHFYRRMSALALALFAGTLCPVPSSFAASGQLGPGQSGTSLTPAPGNPVRKAVLDALRQEVKDMHGLDVVFVVRHLRVKDGWAWVHAEPQSRDGANRYEDISALLLIRDGAWEVAELPCTEVDHPDCLDGPGYFSGLGRRFPGIPAEILPSRPDAPKD